MIFISVSLIICLAWILIFGPIMEEQDKERAKKLYVQNTQIEYKLECIYGVQYIMFFDDQDLKSIMIRINSGGEVISCD